MVFHTFFEYGLFASQAAAIVTIKEIICARCDLVHLKQYIYRDKAKVK